MGLFSRKTIITVSSTTVALVDKEDQSIYKNKVVSEAILRNLDISRTITDGYLHGKGTTARRTYRFAKTKYPIGLPKGGMYNLITDPNKITTALYTYHRKLEEDARPIDPETGKPIETDPKPLSISVTDAVLSSLDGSFLLEDYLYKTYGVRNDEPFTAISPDKNITIYDPYIDFRPSYDKSKGTILTITFMSEEPKEDNLWYRGIKFTVTVEFPNLDLNKVYHHAIYTLNGVPNNFWYYETGSGIYPELDKEYTKFDGTSPYYPIVPLRVNNYDRMNPNNVSKAEYEGSKRILKDFGLDIKDLQEGINSNPDIGEIDHAFFVPAISLNTEQPDSNAYIHEYFSYLYDTQTIDVNLGTEFLKPRIGYDSNGNAIKNPDGSYKYFNPPINRVPRNNIRISVSAYNVTIAFNFVEKITKQGSIGKVGTVKKRIVGYKLVFPEFIGYLGSRTEKAILIERQISDTDIIQFTVVGLMHYNNVYAGRTIEISGEDSLRNLGDEKFLIPLHEQVVRRLGLVKFTQITFDCLHLVINSWDKQKQKWYQTGIFKFVTIVVAIVLAIYGGIQFGAGLLEAMATAAAAGASTTMAAITYIATQILISIAISVGISMLTDVLGIEIMQIVAIAIAVYAAVSSFSSAFQGSKGLPYANEMLSIVPAISKETQERIDKSMQELKVEMQEYGNFAEAEQKRIDEAMKEFDKNVLPINVMIFRDGSVSNLNEHPNAFFTRTLMTNPGEYSIDAIKNWVQYMIELPATSPR